MDKEIMKDLNKEIDEAVRTSDEQGQMDQLLVVLEDVQKEAESLIRRHPIQSVLIAAGIGLLVGTLLSRD